MHRLLTIALAALFTLGSGAALAITYGEPDTNNEYPYVGLVVFYDAAGAPSHRCTGTLLSDTVFLTAGHCTFGMARAQVWFDQQVRRSGGYPYTGGELGTPHTHPGYDEFRTFPNTSDVGVVVLDRPTTISGRGTFPTLGALDGVDARTARFVAVGYGLQEVIPNFQADRDRYKASQMLTELNSALTGGYNARFTNAPGSGTGDGQTASGGTCFGDSGGPVFFSGTRTIAAITSFGLNSTCKGGDYAYRADIANTQDWVRGFLR